MRWLDGMVVSLLPRVKLRAAGPTALCQQATHYVIKHNQKANPVGSSKAAWLMLGLCLAHAWLMLDSARTLALGLNFLATFSSRSSSHRN